MTNEQKVAYINAQATCAILDGFGMQAENHGRLQQGLSLAYTDEDFFKLKTTYGIERNSILSLIKDV